MLKCTWARYERHDMLLLLLSPSFLTMREAAITSSNQQVKIDELEAQLHEAEDIVRDLREELSLVQDELEKLVASRSHLEEPRLTGYTCIGVHRNKKFKRIPTSFYKQSTPKLFSNLRLTIHRSFYKQSTSQLLNLLIVNLRLKIRRSFYKQLTPELLNLLIANLRPTIKLRRYCY